MGNWGSFLGSKAAHQNIRLGMYISLFLGQLTLVYQRLHIGMVRCAVYQLAAVKMVNTGITSVNPVTVTCGVDQKCCKRAVRFLFGRDSRQLDDEMGFLDNLLEHGWRVVGVWRIALKQLFGRHHDLVGCFASATAAAHAVSDNSKQTPRDALMADQVDLILLVITVTLVNAGRSCKSVAF